MRIVAYLYSDPLLEEAPDPAIWGWEIDRVYQDLAIKFTSEKRNPRSQWQQFLQDCTTEPVDYLLIERLEDLGDSVQEISDRLTELESLNIKLIAIEAPTATNLAKQSIVQNSEFQAEMLKFLQQIQRNQRSRRIRQGHARNRVKALPPPGKAPYGYRRGKGGYIIDRTTAPVVKEFFENFLLYGSLRGAVRYLEKKYKKKIAVSTGQRWLTNSVYRGDLEYHNGEIIPDTHAAIISRDEAAQVDRLLRRNRRMPSRTASAPRSLAGLVFCAECQSSMTITRVSQATRSRDYLYLRATNCPQRPKCKAIAYDKILDQTIQQICAELPRGVSEAPLPDMDAIKHGIGKAIANKQAILEQLPPLVSNGVLDQDTADLRMYKIRTEIAKLQRKLAQLPPVNLVAIAQAVSIPQFWLDLSESERRFYFREFIRQIELHHQNGGWQLKLIFIF
jgi:DNA invertase Pin-like site-specific DNA recombinase